MRTVAIWGLVADVLSHPDLAGLSLTASEEQRAERFAFPEDRDSFVAAHLLARWCGVRTGLAVDEVVLVQTCAECGGPHGRPTFAGAGHASVSLSHTRGAVLAAVSDGPVGVDIEPVRAILPVDVAVVLTDRERTWLQQRPTPPELTLRLWCRKEAAVKAYGGGIDRMLAVETVADGGLRTDHDGLRWSEDLSEGFLRCVFTRQSVPIERLTA